jgi:hypothetical protein
MAGKKKPFKIIMDAPAFRSRLGELTGDELKVWMYLWMHTNGEGTAFPGNETISRDLNIYLRGVKLAKKALREKGWLVKVEQRVRPDGTFSTCLEEVRTPWVEKGTDRGSDSDPTEGRNSAHGTVGRKTDDGKTTQLKEDSIHPEVSPLAYSEDQNPEEGKLVSQSASAEDSSLRSSPSLSQDQEQKPEGSEPEEQKQNLKQPWEYPWSNALHDAFGAVASIGGRDLESWHRLNLAMTYFAWDAGTLKGCIQWALTHKFWKTRIVGFKSFVDACHRCILVEEDGGTGEKGIMPQYQRHLNLLRGKAQSAKAGTHAAKNPELHTGLRADGKPWMGKKCTVCDLACTDNEDRACDTCRKPKARSTDEEVAAEMAAAAGAGKGFEHEDAEEGGFDVTEI